MNNLQLYIFTASWCQPCQGYKQMLNENNFPVDLIKIYDIDEVPELTKEYGIRAVPTTILLVNGIESNRKSGAMSREQLMQFIGVA